MTKGLYEILALCARYVFAALMVLIVARAWRITIVDSRRAKTLRRISPETGIIGELMVMEGDEKARRGMKYKVIREGQIGSARRADIRIRHSSVRRRHAYFLLTDKGLRVRSHAGAPLRDDTGRPVKEMLLRDGEGISVGRVQLMLILAHAPESGRHPMSRLRAHREDLDDGGMPFPPGDDLFDTPEDGFDPRIDPFSDFDTPVVRPSRRHLPFTLDDGPGLRTTAKDARPYARRRYGTEPTASGLHRSKPDDVFRVEDNPLNSRRPRSSAEESANDDEMW